MLDGGGAPEAAIPLAVATKPNVAPAPQKETPQTGERNHTKLKIGVLSVTNK